MYKETEIKSPQSDEYLPLFLETCENLATVQACPSPVKRNRDSHAARGPAQHCGDTVMLTPQKTRQNEKKYILI